MSIHQGKGKRKLGSDRHTKGRQPPSKKIRRNAYNSDSDDEDTEITARDAPVSDSRPAIADQIMAQSTSMSRRKEAREKINANNLQDEAGNNEAATEDETESGGDDSLAEETDEFNDAMPDSESSEAESDASEDSQSASKSGRNKLKRRDPAAFATSISAILGSSLSRNKRTDPVLSRSKDAADISKALSESKLEEKARKQLVAERRLAKEKGRIRDVLIGDRKAAIGEDGTLDGQVSGQSAAEILATEKRLRKVAQRGVIHLFNAVRAAQVRGEEESKRVKAEGVIGMGNRDSKVSEMSRNAFLDLVGAGGDRR